MRINQLLNNYIVENGIKQCYISQKTGISQDTLSKILNGNRRILADEFLSICSVLNLDSNMFREKKVL